jgi:hypothetical protein
VIVAHPKVLSTTLMLVGGTGPCVSWLPIAVVLEADSALQRSNELCARSANTYVPLAKPQWPATHFAPFETSTASMATESVNAPPLVLHRSEYPVT